MVAEIERRLKIINEVSQEYGMNIFVKKTMVIVLSRKGGHVNITLNGNRIEQIVKFPYLGS